MRRTLSYLFVLLFLANSHESIAKQTRDEKMDSLKSLAKFTETDTARLSILMDISNLEFRKWGDTSIQHKHQALELATKLKDTASIAFINYYLGNAYRLKNDLASSRLHLLLAKTYFKKTDNKNILYGIYLNFHIINYYRGDYPKSLANILLAFEIAKTTQDSLRISNCHHSIARIYGNQGNVSKALENNFKALDLRTLIGYTPGMAASHLNIGLIYLDNEDFPKALFHAIQSDSLRSLEKSNKNMSEPYSLFSEIYNQKGDYINAIIYKRKAMAIFSQYPDEKRRLASGHNGLGDIYLEKLSISLAIIEYKKALQISLEIGLKSLESNTYANLANAYKLLNNNEDQLFYLEKYAKLNDILKSNQQKEALEEMELHMEIDESQHDIELLEKDAAIQQLSLKEEKMALERNQHILASMSGIGFLGLLFIYLAWNNNKVKLRISNELNEKNKLIDKQRKDITDSIDYAQRIQSAFFAPMDLVDSLFPESFIYFQPKDIVSGDFYWFKESEGSIYFAASDCTGHGVRGAFVTVMGCDLLNDIVDKTPNIEPGELLDELSEELMILLGYEDNLEYGAKDGMDIALCKWNPKSKELQFAGAHSPLYLVKDHTLDIYKSDRFFIGRSEPGQKFQTKSISISNGTMIYLFSDGYPDQKGGPYKKKFYYQPYQQLLIKNSEKPMKEQKDELIKAVNEWKGVLDQIDDIMVMGIRL